MVWNNDFTSDMPVTFIPMAAVDDISGKIVKPQVREIASVWKGYTRFSEGDVLFAKITPCMENGKAAIAHGLINGLGFGSTEFHVLRPTEAVEGKWIFYYVRQQSFRDSAARMMTGTAGQLRVPAKYLSESVIPLAPLAEQQRIVEAIEAQFTRLDAGVAALKRLRSNLKRYKAAVLKAACEGNLVEQDPDDEPASELLKRILKERRAKWAAEQRAKGKDPRKLTYKEPAAPDTADLPDLPEGWVWATVEQLSEVATGATPLRSNLAYYDGGDIAWVTSGALNQPFVVQPSEYITQLAIAETNAKVFPSGTLLVAMYGEGKTRGKVSELIIDAATNQACAALLFTGTAENIKPYVKLFFLKNYEDLRRLASGGVQPNLNLTIIRETFLPLPPLQEQVQIINETEAILSIVDELENITSLEVKRAERLRQAILREAFAGRLVQQDPNDEPAGELLKRIRRDRTRQTNGKKRR